jgi:hypothetical protein
VREEPDQVVKSENGRTPGRRPDLAWWLIARDGDGPLEVLTVEGRGGAALPVFSFREEAELFLGVRSGGWRARETGGGELLSVLYGPYAEISEVALDPLPVEIGGKEAMRLLSLSRETFARLLARRR